MEKEIKSTLTKEELLELDEILTDFYKCVCDEMIEAKDYTPTLVEERAKVWLQVLFKSVKNFETIKRNSKESNEGKKTVEVTDNMEYENENQKKMFEILIKYMVFVVERFKNSENLTKEKVFKLAEAWMKDYLRVEAYKVTYKNF